MVEIVPNVKTGKLRDIIGILDFDFKSQSDKIVYSASSPLNQKPKNVRCSGELTEGFRLGDF